MLFLFHLACAALLAICFRLAADRLAALAGPPLRPPRCPKATAAGFFSGAGSSVASRTMDAASRFKSEGRRFLNLLSMPRV
jgi:hypothetical protein